MNEIIRITGSKKSFCQTCRLERFKGERQEILENSNSIIEGGISELLCADSYERKSYYLNSNQQSLLNKNEKITSDLINFYSTDFRFDNYKNFKSLFSQNKGENELVVFTHEWLLNPPVRKNFFMYFISLYKKWRVKKNINTFMTYCIKENYEFVSNLGEF